MDTCSQDLGDNWIFALCTFFDCLFGAVLLVFFLSLSMGLFCGLGFFLLGWVFFPGKKSGVPLFSSVPWLCLSVFPCLVQSAQGSARFH